MHMEELLKRLPADRKLFESRERYMRVGEVIELACSRRKIARDAGYRRLVIACPDVLDDIIWMVALDDAAQSVFLAPESLRSSDEYRKLIMQAGCDGIVSDARVIEPLEGRDLSEARNLPETEWLLATSGTTGTPKLISHSMASLTRTVKGDLEKGEKFHWGLVYEPFRFAGMQVVLQCLGAGSTLLLCHDLPFTEQLETMCRSGVNALSATPTYWRKVLLHGGLAGLDLRQITLGGEPADQTVINALQRAFPRARITHIYASTEAGVGFSVTDGMEGFPATYLCDGVNGNRLRINEAGTLEIQPLEGTRSTFGHLLAGEKGFIDTGDVVEVRNDRALFRGRLSGAINVGGSKVVPEEVERVIRSVAGVADALVRGKDSTVMGKLVVADVVPESDVEDVEALKVAILKECRSRLDRYKVPAMIKMTRQLEHNATGKLMRKR